MEAEGRVVTERTGLNAAGGNRELQRVLVAAQAMARELHRRELAGDEVAAELCELYEQAISAFERRCGPSYATDLRPVAEALQMPWERDRGPSEARAVHKFVMAMVRRVWRGLGQAIATARSEG
jgi:hypothetical protein